MKNIKKLTGGLVLSLGLLLSGVALAQNPPQTDQKKDGESCSAMASCCCKGDSCSMKEHANKDHAKEHADKDKTHKEHSDKHGCCCCGGDSCKMEMKDKKTS
jgi:hypothetical protein